MQFWEIEGPFNDASNLSGIRRLVAALNSLAPAFVAKLQTRPSVKVAVD